VQGDGGPEVTSGEKVETSAEVEYSSRVYSTIGMGQSAAAAAAAEKKKQMHCMCAPAAERCAVFCSLLCCFLRYDVMPRHEKLLLYNS
jgi:hypothetical protein